MVSLALKRNPIAKEARYAERLQLYREKESFSRLLPKLTFGYSYTHLKEEPVAKFNFHMPQGFPFPLPISGKQKVKTGEHQNVKWDITASWPLFTGFYLTAIHQMEKLGLKATRFRKRLAMLQIAHAARSAYYQVLIAQKNLETARESVKQLEAHLRDAENFYREGLVPYNDVLKAKVALAKAKEAVTRAKEDLETAWVALNLIIRNPDIYAHHRLTDSLEPKPEADLLPLSRLMELALRNRPDVEAARVAVEQAKLSVKAAKSRYYPWVTLYSSYYQQGDNLLANNNDHTNRENFAVGFRIDLLLFDFFGRRYRVHQARSAVLLKESMLEEVKDRVRLQVRKAYADVIVALRNIETARAAVAHAKEDLRITRLQYSQQIASSSDVIDSEKSYIEAKNLYHNALYAYHIALSKLATACGVMREELLFKR